MVASDDEYERQMYFMIYGTKINSRMFPKSMPACKKGVTDIMPIWLSLPILYFLVSILQLWKILMAATHMMYVQNGIEFKVTSRLYEPYFKVHRRCVHYTNFHSGTFNIKTNIHISIMYSTQKMPLLKNFSFAHTPLEHADCQWYKLKKEFQGPV